MSNEQIIERLHVLEELVNNAESNMRLAVISYSRYQEELRQISEELDELEKMIKKAKTRSIFDLFFGNPLEKLDFNQEVHAAIDEIVDD